MTEDIKSDGRQDGTAGVSPEDMAIYEKAKQGDVMSAYWLAEAYLGKRGFAWLDAREVFLVLREAYAVTPWPPALHLASFFVAKGTGTTSNPEASYEMMVLAASLLHAPAVIGQVATHKVITSQDRSKQARKRCKDALMELRQQKRVAAKMESDLRKKPAELEARLDQLESEHRKQVTHLELRLSSMQEEIASLEHALESEQAAHQADIESFGQTAMGRQLRDFKTQLNEKEYQIEELKDAAQVQRKTLTEAQWGNSDMQRRIRYLEGLCIKHGVQFNPIMGHGEHVEAA